MLITYNYRLSELQELNSILEVTNKSQFVTKFSGMIKSMLHNYLFDMFMPPQSLTGMDNFNLSPILFVQYANDETFADFCKKEWDKIKEGTNCRRNEKLFEEVKKRIVFIRTCEDRLKKVYKKINFGNLCFVWRKRSVIIRKMDEMNDTISIKDLLSVAATYYCRQGWGTEKEFEQALGVA